MFAVKFEIIASHSIFIRFCFQIRADVDMLKAQLRGDGMMAPENMGLDKHRSGQFQVPSQTLGFMSAYPTGNLSPGSGSMSVPGSFGVRQPNVNPYDTMNSYGGNKRRAAQPPPQQNYNRNSNRRGRRVSRKGQNKLLLKKMSR
jgi:hypothetical protein